MQTECSADLFGLHPSSGALDARSPTAGKKHKQWDLADLGEPLVIWRSQEQGGDGSSAPEQTNERSAWTDLSQ